MVPRVAMRSTLSSDVFDRVLSFTGFDFQLPFNTSKSGLSPTLTPSLQQVIHDYAERAAVWLEPNPLERVYHPPMNQAALEDFGRWCQQGCPVTLDGLVYRYRWGNASSLSDSSRRVYTV